MLLWEEFQGQGVEVVFLKGAVDETPEGKLLLHMQGAIAEYERTKTAERTRRGKLYWARQGALVGYMNAYGYRFVRRTDAQKAHLEVEEAQALVVQQMYRWLLEEHLSTRGIARRLTELGVPTARGASQWQPTAVDRILRNPAYKGTYIYQRSQSALPARRLSADPYRQGRKTGRKPRPQGEWIPIGIPPIVDEAIWEAAQRQLVDNALHSRRNNKRHQYLLRGLIRCPRCGGTYTEAFQHGQRFYRCGRTDPTISSTGRRCPPGAFRAGPVEQAVWETVADALRSPEVLVQEYQRRLSQAASPQSLEAERRHVSLALRRVKAQEDRVTDAYINEAMDLERYKAEMNRLRQRRKGLERASQDIDRRERQELDRNRALEHLDAFCQRIAHGLDNLTFEERQRLLQLLVERITLEDNRVRVDLVIPTSREPDVQLCTRHQGDG
jgi:site-specific DNA recombinase